ncbi:MAG: cupin domain-containing protein [Acidobacteriota bacterium]
MNHPEIRNLLLDLLPALESADDAEERVDVLVETSHLRIERIVSTGQASPPGFWYDQDEHEWVLLLSGHAGLRFEHEDEVRRLAPGDQVDIPAHARHRVEWTSESEPTVWLAVFYRS